VFLKSLIETNLNNHHS